MPRRSSHRERLDHTISVVQQRHGPQALRRGAARAAVPHISTGFAALDDALGIGGIPRGRVTVLAGAPTSGKRTLAALILAQAQERGRRPVALIDLEGACDADYLERCGVRLDGLLVGRPLDARQALDLAVSTAERAELAAVVFDHWSALPSDAALRRYAAAALDRLATLLARSNVAVVVLEDTRAGWLERLSAWADPAQSALAHHAALRLALRREEWLTLGPDVRGYRVGVAVEKNKLGAEGGSATVEIRFNGTVRGAGL
ncbi:MAG: hypothetical protein U0822_08010 [Anaerolineae bacterium]